MKRSLKALAISSVLFAIIVTSFCIFAQSASWAASAGITFAYAEISSSGNLIHVSASGFSNVLQAPTIDGYPTFIDPTYPNPTKTDIYVQFIVPWNVPGDHNITVSDGSTTITLTNAYHIVNPPGANPTLSSYSGGLSLTVSGIASDRLTVYGSNLRCSTFINTGTFGANFGSYSADSTVGGTTTTGYIFVSKALYVDVPYDVQIFNFSNGLHRSTASNFTMKARIGGWVSGLPAGANPQVKLLINGTDSEFKNIDGTYYCFSNLYGSGGDRYTIVASPYTTIAGTTYYPTSVPAAFQIGYNTYASNYLGKPITYTAGPSITNMSPTTGPVTTTVTLDGTSFGSTKGMIHFGGIPIYSTSNDILSWTNTKIVFNVPASAAGGTSYSVYITTASLFDSNSMTFTVSSSTPTVTSVAPNSGSNTAATTVTITGTNFTGATAVNIGSTPVSSFTVNSATQITATIPSGLPAGPYDITVTAGGVTSATSANDQFTVLTPTTPTVTSVAPNSGSNTAATTVTITGTNFTGATAVKIGNTAVSSFAVNSATQITATIQASLTPGTYDMTVTGPGGTSATSANDRFTVTGTANPPTVTSVSPSSGSNAYPTIIIITGTNLTGTTAVKIGNTAVSSFTVNSATQITATIQASLTPGAYDMTVTGPAGTSATSANDRFTVTGNANAPTITSVNPNSGINTYPTIIVITGTNLTGATAVKIGNTAVSSFTVNSDTQITATIQASLTPGAYDMTVTGPAGTSAVSPADHFTVTTALVSTVIIDTVSPNFGNVGISVTLTGEGFTQTKGSVFFNNQLVSDVTFWSSNQIIFTVPRPQDNQTGWKDIYVVAGGNESNHVIFNVTSLTPGTGPSITSIDPTAGPTGESVTLAGMNFGDTKPTVMFDGTPVDPSQVTLWTSTQIIFTVPKVTSTGWKDVYVQNGAGTSNHVIFNVTSLTPGTGPSITSIVPTSGEAGSTIVTLEGVYLGTNPPNELHFGTQANGFPIVQDIVSWSSTRIVFKVPKNALYGANRIYVKSGSQISNSVVFLVTRGARTESVAPVHCYPNPFDPNHESTNLVFTLTGQAKIGLYIYDLSGRMVYKEEKPVVPVSNLGTMIWDGKDAKAKIVANGVYIATVINRDSNKLIGRCKVFVAKK